MEEKAARGRKEKEVMLGVMGLGGGGEKKPWGPGSEKQKLHPGIALLALHGLWVKQWWEMGAEGGPTLLPTGCSHGTGAGGDPAVPTSSLCLTVIAPSGRWRCHQETQTPDFLSPGSPCPLRLSCCTDPHKDLGVR